MRELEEIFDFLALLRVHLFEDRFGFFFREFGEEVGGRTWVHLFDDARNLLGVEGLEEGFLEFGFDLLEGLGRGLLVERGEEYLSLCGGQFFEDVGDVRRVHLGEPVLIDLQANAAGGVDEVDEVPGNRAGAESRGDEFDSGARKALEETAHCSAEANFNVDDAERETCAGRSIGCPVLFAIVLPDQVDVVDADYFVAVDVDDLLIEEVALEEDESRVVW